MKKNEFKELLEKVIDIYGIEFDAEEDLWFQCPECGEPLYYEDYQEPDQIDYTDNYFICPVCEEQIDL